MENQTKNLRFYKNVDFCSTSLEMLYNLGHEIIECDSYFVPDEMRAQFQSSKRELLDFIDDACGHIRYMRNYKNTLENGEDNAKEF